MKEKRKDSAKTRQRLLKAATKVFASKSFTEATIAKICEQAGTNVASVNYHFGDKKNLYAESWRHAFHQSLKSYPPDGGIRDDANPEKRLQARIRSLLHRAVDQNSCDFFILFKELANPTGLLMEILDKEISPRKAAMHSIVKELLGPQATERQVQFCHASIMGNFFYLLHLRQLNVNRKTTEEKLKIDDIDAFVDHVIKFSLAGIREVRREISAHIKSKDISQGEVK